MTRKKKAGISKLLGFGGRYRWMTIVTYILSRLNSAFMLRPSLCIWLVLRDVSTALPDLSTMNMKMMTLYGWATLGLAVGDFLLYLLALLFSHPDTSHTAKNIQFQIPHHLTSLPLGLFSQSNSGKLWRIIHGNTAQTENLLAHQFPDMTGSVVTAVAMLVMLLLFDWKLGGLSILLLTVGFMVQMLTTSEKSMSYMRKCWDASGRMNNETVEYICDIPTVKVLQRTIYSFKSFCATIMYYKGNVVEYALSCQEPMVTLNVIINASFIILVPVGILLVGPEQYSGFLLDLAFYIPFTSGSAGILNKILFSSTYRMIAQEAMRRVDSLLVETSVVEDVLIRVPDRNDVELRDMAFTYPGTKAPALFHLSFQVPEGKAVALVGASGSRKTTAAALIPRLWDVQEEMAYAGGAPVSQISKQELMSHITLVFRGSRLLKTSIFENVRASRPDTIREQVVETLRSTRCDDTLEKLPKGMDTALEIEGVCLSDGEQQCIALMRAALKDAPIILLDGTTAFADPENEHKTQMAFKRLTRGETVLMVAHRLPATQNADETLVLEQGAATERGAHDLLMARNGIYTFMWRDYQISAAWNIGRERRHVS